MSSNAIGTTILGPGVLTLGSASSLHTMSNQVTSVKLVPKVDKDKGLTVLSGLKKGGARSESWTLEGKFIFDLGTADSTSDFLFENRGKDMPFTFTPATAREVTFTGTVTIESSDIGGDVDVDNQEVDFSFELVGEPTKKRTAAAGG
ncbi:hypothetical protein E4U03_10965 [Rothia nasimurium]|uniref:Phage tail protein n=1 Tax=Rothia nasimurium TaxID=85336 RepID=A0A4Y9F0Z5_9MICC|nr:hypothetical protein [Rothia nasimurium]MBF0809119.1 hypothetical protein [Rothia nasimurium]TFU20641.1 hypothetical protein E4U03_10965 [Rothia nasimurium]